MWPYSSIKPIRLSNYYINIPNHSSHSPGPSWSKSTQWRTRSRKWRRLRQNLCQNPGQRIWGRGIARIRCRLLMTSLTAKRNWQTKGPKRSKRRSLWCTWPIRRAPRPGNGNVKEGLISRSRIRRWSWRRRRIGGIEALIRAIIGIRSTHRIKIRVPFARSSHTVHQNCSNSTKRCHRNT